MKEVKRFVVLDTGAIIDLGTYGIGSWGSYDQCYAEVRGDKVYEIDIEVEGKTEGELK